MKRLMVLLMLAASPAAAGQVGPSEYLSFADSPWASQNFSYFYLEDYEDGLLNTPGVTASGATAILPAGGAFNDSVDADDGTIDGSGTNGSSHYAIDGIAGITYTFDANILGSLPTHAGLVWTDLSDTAEVFFEAFDENSLSLGTINAGALNDGSSVGETAEDRFLGWEYPGGISSIRIFQSGSDLEADHLQYGRLIPEPNTLFLLASVIVTQLIASRRHRDCRISRGSGNSRTRISNLPPRPSQPG